MSNAIKRAPGARGHLVPDDHLGQSLVKPWAIDSQRLGIRRINLDTALSREQIDISGSFLWVVGSSQLSATANIAFRQDSIFSDGVPLRRGLMLSGLKFEHIFVSCAAQAGDYLLIVYCDDITGDLKIENSGDTYGDATVNDTIPPNSLVSIPDVEITAGNTISVSASLAGKRSVAVKSLGTNVEILRVGGAGTTAGQGHELNAGDVYTIDTSAEVLVYNPGAASQYVSVTESRRV